MPNVINIDDLLREIAPGAPCGEELEYDPDFMAMDHASLGRSEQQVGGVLVPGEEADWQTVKSKALDLFGRTKDIRVAVFLTRALTVVDQLWGLRDGLDVVRGLIDRYWDDFHPRLDPDDASDPTARVNALQNLRGTETMLRHLREVELAAAMGVGRFSFRDYLVADGRMPAASTAGVSTPEMASIQAALLECAVEQLQEKAQAVRECLALVGSIEAGLLSKVGSVHAIGFAPLTDLLREMDGILTSSLLQRGGDDPVVAVGAATAGIDTGQVKSREDVIRLLDRACDYFQRHEPSSPVPLLLKRAKGLVDKEFLEIMRDLAPGGVTEAEKILGRDAK